MIPQKEDDLRQHTALLVLAILMHSPYKVYKLVRIFIGFITMHRKLCRRVIPRTRGKPSCVLIGVSHGIALHGCQ